MSVAVPLIVLGLVIFGGGGKKKKKKTITEVPPLFDFPPDEPPPPPPPPGGPPKLDVPPPPPPGVTPFQVYGNLLKPEPTIGALYQIRAGDNPSNIARRALGVGVGSERTVPYLRSMTRNRWNWMLYATKKTGSYGWRYVPGDTSSDNPPGFINAAWLPGNDNVQAAVQAGELPHRRWLWGNPNPNATQPAGNGRPVHGGGGGHYGVVMLPPEDGCGGNGDDPACLPVQLLGALGASIGDLNPNM